MQIKYSEQQVLTRSQARNHSQLARYVSEPASVAVGHWPDTLMNENVSNMTENRHSLWNWGESYSFFEYYKQVTVEALSYSVVTFMNYFVSLLS